MLNGLSGYSGRRDAISHTSGGRYASKCQFNPLHVSGSLSRLHIPPARHQDRNSVRIGYKSRPCYQNEISLLERRPFPPPIPWFQGLKGVGERYRGRAVRVGYRGLYSTEGSRFPKEIDFHEPVEYLVPNGDHEGRHTKNALTRGHFY